VLDSLEQRNRQAIDGKLAYTEFLAMLLHDEVARRDQKKLGARCVFHTKLDKDFAASWTGFSHEAGHGFHGKLDSDFAPGWTVRS
jgi:hypothetical protein